MYDRQLMRTVLRLLFCATFLSLITSAIFSHCFGALADGVFRKPGRQSELYGALNLSRTDSTLFVVRREFCRFRSDTLEHVWAELVFIWTEPS